MAITSNYESLPIGLVYRRNPFSGGFLFYSPTEESMMGNPLYDRSRFTNALWPVDVTTSEIIEVGVLGADEP